MLCIRINIVIEAMIGQKLLWEKYRPTKMEELILPDRIRNILSDGIKTNFIFMGPPGIGKTTTARVLASEGQHPVKEISAGSDSNAVEVLRTDVDRFVGHYGLMTAKNDAHKVVILDEFERASKPYQVALQPFIENHSDKVRFIACSNSTTLISDAIKSRIKEIDFRFINKEETLAGKKALSKRLRYICDQEGYELTDKQIIAHVNKYFPDLRRAVEELQYSQTDLISTPQASTEDLYQMICSDCKPDELWDFILSNYDMQFDTAFKALGRPFFGNDGYLKKKHAHIHPKVITPLSYIYTQYMIEWRDALDPLVMLVTVCYKYQEVIQKQ